MTNRTHLLLLLTNTTKKLEQFIEQADAYLSNLPNNEADDHLDLETCISDAARLKSRLIRTHSRLDLPPCPLVQAKPGV